METRDIAYMYACTVVKNLPAKKKKKESACQCRRHGFDPWVGTIPWSKKWQPTPVFLPGKFQGQRRLAGCSPWGRKELGMTQRLSMHAMKKTLEL